MKKHLTTILTLAMVILLVSLFPSPSRGADSLCARVKIEIDQKLTFERQAFDAHMTISNGLSNIALNNVRIDVGFTDEDGNPVLASFDPNATGPLFYIRVLSKEGINDISGNGTVSPSSTADIHWLIIPAANASNGLQSGKLYYVGATLKYTIGGQEMTTAVSPDYVFVKPMPQLTLDYFLPFDVYGDDPFTDGITEPAIPFSLGVRVKNTGSGVAKNLKIDSAQPKIVDNKQGLLVGFNIEATEINGVTVPNTLLANFGDIQSHSAAVARWIMTCTLSGKFVKFDANYSHSDELGGQLTSLMNQPITHTLIHDVFVDLPGRDTYRDFLAKDGSALKLYESECIDVQCTDSMVADQSTGATLTLIAQAGSESTYRLSFPITGGYAYVQLADPLSGAKIIKSVTRSDGKQIKLDNAWLSKTRDKDNPWQYFFNLFDVNTTDSYTVVFADAVSLGPTLGDISPHSVVEGQTLAFNVTATHPSVVPALAGNPLPAGASFVDQHNGSGTLSWTPQTGQAGTYPITFTATDGTVMVSRSSTITVTAGAGSNTPPSAPSIPAPADGANNVAVATALTWSASTDADSDAVTYDVYIGAGASALNRVSMNQHAASYSPPSALAYGTTYYWKITARDEHGLETAGPIWRFTTVYANGTLTVTRLGAGSGTITSVPAGINCGGSCSAPFTTTTEVTLTAVAATGSGFSTWSGCDSVSGITCIVTINGNKNVTATFVPAYALNVGKNGSGSGTVVSGDGKINCDPLCHAAFNYNSTVSLTATPDADSVFAGFTFSGLEKVIGFDSEADYFQSNANKTKFEDGLLSLDGSVTGSWTSHTALPNGRSAHTAVVINNKVYVHGGNGAAAENDLDQYDPATNTWTQKTNGSAPALIAHSAVNYNGKMYTFGGQAGAGVTNSLWHYDPAATENAWQEIAQSETKPSARRYHSAAVINGAMYVYGGQSDVTGGVALNDVWAYNIGTNSWEQKAAGPSPRYSHRAAAIGGKMYVVGGKYGTGSESICADDLWSYDPATDSWEEGASRGAGVSGAAVVEKNGKLLVFGGHDGTTRTNELWEYDPVSDSWTQKNSANGATVRTDVAGAVANDSLYIVGGDSGASNLGDTWQYRETGDYPVDGAAYVTTLGTSAATLSGITSIDSVRAEETTPPNTSLKYLLSFDGRATWKYWNGSWQASELADMETNGMTKAALVGIAQADWAAAGGFVAGTTTTLDFAVSLKSTDTNVTPTVDRITVAGNGGTTASNPFAFTISGDASVTATFSIANHPPVLGEIGNQAVAEGHELSFVVSATDPENNTLTYSAENLPTGANFDPATHTFTWMPTYGQAGTYNGIIFRVTDNGTPALHAEQTITIVVTNVHRYTITASTGGGGSITPSGAATVNEGSTQTYSIVADTGYHILDVKVDGASLGAATSYSFQNIVGNHTIEAAFAINQYTITASAGANGAISPSGTVNINYGGSQVFTITPNTGYHIAEVRVDGKSIGADKTHVFADVLSNHTITAIFEEGLYGVDVPRTGQTASYAGEDDGYYQTGAAWPDPRFAVNASTLYDHMTGLTWSLDWSTPTFGVCTGGAKTWQEALDYVDCLNANNYLGRNDWRLPNLNELESLLHAGKTDTTTWLLSVGLVGVAPGNYWASTTSAIATSNAWVIDLTGGNIVYDAKDATGQVAPVGGVTSGETAVPWTGQMDSYAAGDDGDLLAGVELPDPRFTTNPDSTLTDNLTGLIWAPDLTVPQYQTCMGGATTWSAALGYISCLNTAQYLGHNDWRLPNLRELRSIIDYGREDMADYLTSYGFIAATDNAAYWSSTTCAAASETAWTVGILSGQAYGHSKGETAYLAMVRSGTVLPPIDVAPPITVVSLPAGTYTQAQSVTLTCSDGPTGSGCDKIYYTTDGSVPTVSSAVYSSPISIPATTTLKFFARDVAGNMETVKSVAYTITTGTPNVTVRLTDSSGNPLGGAAVQYYSGGWKTFGATDANGQASMQLSAGSYTFAVNYAYGRQEKSQNIGTNPTVVFQTTRVAVQLKDSTGALIDTGTVQYYAGGWRDIGTTSGGQAIKELLPGAYTFSMTYAYGRQEKSQNITTSSTVVFQTTRVVVQLQDSTGALIDTGSIQYYAGGWRDMGSTSGGQAFKELMPGTYTFSMNYANGRQEKSQNIGTNATVVFQTTRVAVQLQDSAGALMDTGMVQYYAAGWRDLGSTSGGQASKELLPGTYTFSMTYAYGRQEKSQNIGTNATVVFQTTRVAVQLQDSAGALMDTGTVQYYAGGWRDMGSTSGGQAFKELMPGTYTFSMNYANGRQEKSQNIGTNATVIFQTTRVAVQLKDSAGALIDTGSVQYYAGGWRDLGNTSGGQAIKELLPGAYTFSMTYAYGRQEKSQNITAASTVVFQTAQVHSDSDTCIGYYAGGWRTFTQDKDLLPGTYTFRFNDGIPQTNYTVVVGSVTHIH